MKIALKEIVNVIRSKNAGPFELTLDVLLKEQEMFELLQKADVINKATIVRPMPSGALGERDVYVAQQHAPLVNFTFEI